MANFGVFLTRLVISSLAKFISDSLRDFRGCEIVCGFISIFPATVNLLASFSPTLFCHELKVNNDLIEDIKLRLPDHKRKSVQYLQKLNFEVVAAGDSYNDLGMLKTADYCMFYSPPEQLVQEYPDIKVGRDYPSLLSFIESPNS